jgi:hypothetical protein
MRIWIAVVAGSPDFLLAEETVATSDCKGNNDPIASAQMGYILADLFDNAHELVAQHISCFHRWDVPVVEVQVRTADGGSCDFYNCVMRIQEPRIRHGERFNVAFSHPTNGFHKFSDLVLEMA